MQHASLPKALELQRNIHENNNYAHTVDVTVHPSYSGTMFNQVSNGPLKSGHINGVALIKGFFK